MRVVAGELRGRRLASPKGQRTRPTSDRVREALFSILSEVRGASVVDLYAGTGALGIEALSRGASRAVFVEHDRAALTSLRANLHDLALVARAEVRPGRVETSVAALVALGPFDLVFADPPYALVEQAMAALERLARAGALAAGARVVLEHASRSKVALPPGWTELDDRTYGDTGLAFLSPAPTSSPASTSDMSEA
jgi:16S rRNA (guanine966-N2)-methyltransferase